MTMAVEAAGLAKDHAGEKALRGVSFQVPEGTLFGVIGADGAGKSTLMNILSTLTDADSGTARVLGLDLAKSFPDIRKDIGYMPQRFSLYQDLSVEENLDFFADIFALSTAEKKSRMDSLLKFAALTDFRNRRAGNLSGGMKQKLALACTLIHRPRLLFLDEPTVGVDPVARRDFWTLLKSLRQEGIALMVSTPYMDEAALCDRLILLHEGRILAEGSPADLLKAYPYRLFRVDGKGRTLHYPADKPAPEGFALLYPSAGALHAAGLPGGHRDGLPGGHRSGYQSGHGDRHRNQLGDQPEDLSEALASIRKRVPEADTIHPIQPSVEDVFFALLSGVTRP